MKITKAQIRKIIKEELIKEMALEDADPIKVHGTFGLIDVKLDNLKRSLSFATPEEMSEDIADIRQAVKDLRIVVIGL
jgi:hypothetical protein